MVKLYYYFFYRNYWWDIKIIKNNEYPVFASSVGVSMFLLLNFISLIELVVITRLIQVSNTINLYVGASISLMVINYSFFTGKQRFKKIVSEFETLERKEKVKLDIVCIVYMLISIVSAIWLLTLHRNNIYL
jgi:glucan phosphoethanolaminetransferase (alkaline phosphatase superfamily)